MHCVRSVKLCATVILSDLRCATFDMHLIFACTAAWNADCRHVLVMSYLNVSKLCACRTRL